jgi:hypothetical protein
MVRPAIAKHRPSGDREASSADARLRRRLTTRFML